ncbi:MAG TPA: DUF4440 domain-containing protein [Phenylobacterium sp.]|jgi:hypothetical protein
MNSPEDAIRTRRGLTNKLIAAREAKRLRPFFTADARLISGDGTLILGAEAITNAFAEQFRQPSFVAYVRTPEAVAVDHSGSRGSETGRWTGNGVSGVYMAAWRLAKAEWVIESELYVTLAHS